MASESNSTAPLGILHLISKPKLTVVRDINDYPAAAKCSACGEEMPLRGRWITSAAQNLAWFADQFRIHVEQEHPAWSPETLRAQGELIENEAA
jgi:hypothetical protein